MTHVQLYEPTSAHVAGMIEYHIEHSKRKADYHFRMAEFWGADGDYLPGIDDGEPQQGAQW